MIRAVISSCQDEGIMPTMQFGKLKLLGASSNRLAVFLCYVL